jgi:hypothetical protein
MKLKYLRRTLHRYTLRNVSFFYLVGTRSCHVAQTGFKLESSNLQSAGVRHHVHSFSTFNWLPISLMSGSGMDSSRWLPGSPAGGSWAFNQFSVFYQTKLSWPVSSVCRGAYLPRLSTPPPFLPSPLWLPPHCYGLWVSLLPVVSSMLPREGFSVYGCALRCLCCISSKLWYMSVYY